MCVNARVCRGLGAGDGEVLEEHGNVLGAAAEMALAAAFLAARVSGDGVEERPRLAPGP